jgi:hypothetical protein
MKHHALKLLTAGFAMLSVSAFAELVVIEMRGEQIIHDRTNNLYWYRDLPDMLEMTKADQRAFIQRLNAHNYAGQDDWAFATLAQMTAMMASMSEGAASVGDAVVRRWPVEADQYFVATQYIDAEAQRESLPVGSHWLFCGRTADELVMREDLINEPPYFTEHEKFGEGQYHFPLFDYFGDEVITEGVFDVIMYDLDVNYMADDEFTSPAPRATDPTSNMPPLDCAAWVVATP